MQVSELEKAIQSFNLNPIRVGRWGHKWFARSGLLEGLGETLEEAVQELLKKVRGC